MREQNLTHSLQYLPPAVVFHVHHADVAENVREVSKNLQKAPLAVGDDGGGMYGECFDGGDDRSACGGIRLDKYPRPRVCIEGRNTDISLLRQHAVYRMELTPIEAPVLVEEFHKFGLWFEHVMLRPRATLQCQVDLDGVCADSSTQLNDAVIWTKKSVHDKLFMSLMIRIVYQTPARVVECEVVHDVGISWKRERPRRWMDVAQTGVHSNLVAWIVI